MLREAPQEANARMARHESITDISSLSAAESVLQSLIPSTYKAELNAHVRMLSLLSTHTPHILAQQQFTKNEWSLLLTLLSFYPYYAPYEVLLDQSDVALSCCLSHKTTIGSTSGGEDSQARTQTRSSSLVWCPR